MAAPVILWFRRALRLDDNPVVRAAAASGRPVIALYVHDAETPGAWAPGGASCWWLHHALAGLSGALAARGASLVLRRGRLAETVLALVRETGAETVFAELPTEPWARAAYRQVKAELGPRLKLALATLGFHPEQVRTRAGTPFGVFTPFSRACLDLPPPPPPQPAPQRLEAPAAPPASDRLDEWGLLPRAPDWSGGLAASWTPGEAGAAARLQGFVAGALPGYAARRDLPGIASTSMLSPHLAFGEISVGRIWHAAQAAGGAGAGKFVSELLWREFAAHLLWHHPTLPEAPLRPEFARMPWREDPPALRAWQRGRTGVPIVDAGMRQLWQTGWMHNRVRMIAASFLVKHLLIPWQAGEAWFWDTLVDADLAQNASSWQWVAGSGADAAPYFRIFNPVLQGRKFDPDGAYVRRFVPELAHLPPDLIHAPWEKGGVPGYPPPAVELGAGRARALAAFAALKGTA